MRVDITAEIGGASAGRSRIGRSAASEGPAARDRGPPRGAEPRRRRQGQCRLPPLQASLVTRSQWRWVVAGCLSRRPDDSGHAPDSWGNTEDRIPLSPFFIRADVAAAMPASQRPCPNRHSAGRALVAFAVPEQPGSACHAIPAKRCSVAPTNVGRPQGKGRRLHGVGQWAMNTSAL